MQRFRPVRLAAGMLAVLVITLTTIAANPALASTRERAPLHAVEAIAFTAPSGLFHYLHTLAVLDYVTALAEQDELARLEARWIPVGRCEQPSSSGWQGVDWSADGWNHVGRFVSGLGILAEAWAENYVEAGAPASASDATPHQQMRVAESIFRKHGRGAWSCPLP